MYTFHEKQDKKTVKTKREIKEEEQRANDRIKILKIHYPSCSLLKVQCEMTKMAAV